MTNAIRPASISCIYNLGSPVEYGGAVMHIKEGVRIGFETAIKMLTKMFYERNDIEFKRGNFRIKGEVIEIFPAYADSALRLQFLGDTVERVTWVDPLTGEGVPTNQVVTLYPAKHYITPESRLLPGIKQIEEDLEKRLKELRDHN
jgi:excinuclease ABC subunit B